MFKLFRAEPSVVEQAKWEFAETERMLKTAEDLLGDYVWGRYDMVVMPRFFPMGFNFAKNIKENSLF